MRLINKILSFFKNKHFQSLLGTGFNAFIGFVIFALLFRALSANDLGLYILFTIVLNLIDTIKGGFITNAFITFFSGVDTQREKEVAGSSWGLAIIITLVLVIVNIILYLFIPYISDESVILIFRYFSIVSISTLPSFMANIIVQGENKFDRLLWLRLMSQLLFVASIIILMFLHKSTLTSIIMAFIGSNLMSSIAALILKWTRIRDIRFATRKTILEIFHFGKYSFGTSLSANLFSVTDNFFIKAFLGPASIAIYSLGGKLIQIVEIPLLSFKISTMPNMSAFYNKDYRYNVIYVMKKMIGMLSIPLVFVAIISIIFANPIIAILGGKHYLTTEAPNLFRIFMTMAIFYPADRFSALALDVIHKPQINFYKILIMLAINLIADYIGVKLVKSIYSIALTNIFPILAAIIISYVPLNKYYKFNFWSIYSVGYHEFILLAKQIIANITGKKKAQA